MSSTKNLKLFNIFYPSIKTDDTRTAIASQIEFNTCSLKYIFDVDVLRVFKKARNSYKHYKLLKKINRFLHSIQHTCRK